LSNRVLAHAVVALCAVGWSADSARAEPAPPRKVASVEGITEYRLANGLRVLLSPDPSLPRVTINLTVFAGSRHEGYGEAGMAHLLEHMLFKGTPTHPDIPRLLKERGARSNASTWLDCTNFYETLTASDDNLAFALRLEADRLVNSWIRETDLATEMAVVRSEFGSGENSPPYILQQRMRAAAYEWHNYGKPEIGCLSDIERVPIDRLRAFYRKHYRPDNAMLIVAGRFDEAKALEGVSRYFGALAGERKSLDVPYTEEPAQDGERSVTLRRVGDVGAVGVLYHVPAGAHPDFAPVQLLSRILTSGPSSRLGKALVGAKKASSVEGRVHALHDPGTLLIMAKVDKGESQDDVRDVMVSAIERVREEGVTREEVAHAREQILTVRDLMATDPDPNRFVIELSNWAAAGDWRLFFLHRDRVEQVTPEQVQAVARRYLRPNNRTVGFLIPTAEPDRTAIPPTPDSAAMVEGYKGREVGPPGEAFDVTATGIEARLVRPERIEGVEVALLPKRTRNRIVHLVLNLRYGDASNLRGLVEASGLLPGLLTRGTKLCSRQQIEEALDRSRSRLSVRGGPGSVNLALVTRRESLPVALALIGQVLREATLPAEEFGILKSKEIARLEESRTDPQRVAANQLMRLLSSYPHDDIRYVPTIDERIVRVKATRLEQVMALYEQYLGAGQGELVVVGDFEQSEVLPALTETLKGWTAKRPYARIPRPYQPDLKPQRRSILTRDKADATYLAGLILPMGDGDSDYPALVIGNFILGGTEYDNSGLVDVDRPLTAGDPIPRGEGSSSRLVDRLRHHGGVCYGVASFFTASHLDRSAQLMIYANCSPADIHKVERGVAEELVRWVEEGVQPEELARAKTSYLENQQVDRTDDAMLARLIARLLRDGLTVKHVAELEDHIRRLTPEAVSLALRRHVDPARLSSVVVGDFKLEGSGPRK
jgi:zinc protease